MSVSAIVLMLVALVTVWGGLVVTSIMLARQPNARGGWADTPEMDHDDVHLHDGDDFQDGTTRF